MIGWQLVKQGRTGVYEQSLSCPRHAYIIPTQHFVRQMKWLCKEHIDIIKLTTFRLVDGRNDDIRPSQIAEILYRRLKDKAL